jgi:hypothetical protein
MDQKGITRQTRVPYSPALNGIADQMNRGILDPTRSMLKHAGVPLTFWAEAAAVAVYIKKRVLHRALDGISPFQVLYGKKPDISHLQTFGCLAYAQVPAEKRKKLDDGAKRCVFIRYTETTSIWKLYDITAKQAFTSTDVKFDESTLYRHQGTEGTTPEVVPLESRPVVDSESELPSE